MADLVVPYTLTTPGGVIAFNSGDLFTDEDLYWIQTINGLDGAPIRAPADLLAFGDGGVLHDFRKGMRRPVFDGVILIQSIPLGSPCQALLNQMEDDLRVALESIADEDATGTLDWTPTGMSARSLTVKCEVINDFMPIENYALRSFGFGLISASSSWS